MISVMETIKRINTIEKELQYFQKGNDWQPFHYNLFIQRLEWNIESLRNIVLSTPDTNYENIRAMQLLNQYEKLWNEDFH